LKVKTYLADLTEVKIIQMLPEREPVNVAAIEAGNRLRETRLSQGLTLQRVEELGARIAAALNNPEFAIPVSRLSHIETKGVVPSFYRVHSLARIYRLNPDVILEWYGVVHGNLEALQLEESPHGRFAFFRSPSKVTMPVALDPSFDPKTSGEIVRMVETWGEVPFTFLKRFRNRQYLYGYVGLEDLTLSPILPPGSFVQIDPERRNIKKSGWNNEYDRPIYAVETQDGIRFAWCAIIDRKLILEPHPLSPVEMKMFNLDNVDVLGQVVGAAIRVGGSSSPAILSLR
jgi:transcriptional regulator with XRE-family HTH domain